ncbi:DUF2141 domain-containing protein [Altibacter sp.]|uniref:DUF2141 domain-containing protein n=1 Tax=Altibacter sp. TaxID=2024823 RepID=UPI000C8E897E|nr:DUF2141 domain-containing protein [Altibacter sp.]MAP55038.1 hypothetical protein [Altibacter sp.]|tara:strand:- start:224 stop:652 length:429 start_codon:yes stop_codon:yes gene_type:complete
MKTLLLTLTLTLSAYILQAQTENVSPSEGTTLTVTVPVQSTEGHVIFALYDETTFLKQPLMGLESTIVDGKATVTFTSVLPGTYAVVLFHDKNDNKQMDFEANGMPKEMYGASNNVLSFGPPQWNDSKFEVGDEPLTFEIIM